MELMRYEPATGVFIALVAAPGRPAGSRVGWVAGKGYRNVSIDGRSYRMNRLAWLYMTGEFPSFLIDHKDRDRDNDAWENLRAATNAENSRNCNVSIRNSSGVKGVYWYARKQKWNAQIRVDRGLMSLGYFSDIADAASARRAAEIQYFGAFASS